MCEMAGMFYGAFTTPSRRTSRLIGRTIQLTPAHSLRPGNGQLQPSIANVMKIMETLQREIEMVRRLTENQSEKMMTLAKTLEAAQSRLTGPSDSWSKTVPKDALVSPLCHEL